MNLQLNELTKRYGAKEALKGISLTVEGGRTLGFLGRNGAGKTTTLRILAGVFAPDGGSVVYNGAPLDRRATTVGYLPEERGLYSKVGILDQLTYIGQLKGMNRSQAKNAARRCLQEFELEDCAGKPLGTLSKGNQQKVQIIQSLLNDPDILILDEPFSGLDPVNARALKRVIRSYESQGKILIFSSHEMSYVEEFCTDIAIIREGSILLSGELQRIRRSQSNGRVYLTVSGMDPKALCSALQDVCPRPPLVVDEKAVVQLTESFGQNALFSAIAARDLQVESYGVYEPSVESIFVETNRAAEEAEAG